MPSKNFSGWLIRFTCKRWTFHFLIAVIFLFLLPCRDAFGYRPFVSTDAAVAGHGEWEVELGILGFSHNEGIDEVTAPSVRLNYGILKNWELVGEFDVQIYKEGDERDLELKDPSMFFKGVLREGILQNRQGPSFAIELGVLLPSTVKGEGRTGLEGSGILSGEMAQVAYHLNLGVELDREQLDPSGIWGVILEYPFEGKLRLVGEINGVFKQNGLPDNSGLLGFIWETGRFDFDFGVRKGFSNAAADWELTTGMTFSF